MGLGRKAINSEVMGCLSQRLGVSLGQRMIKPRRPFGLGRFDQMIDDSADVSLGDGDGGFGRAAMCQGVDDPMHKCVGGLLRLSWSHPALYQKSREGRLGLGDRGFNPGAFGQTVDQRFRCGPFAQRIRQGAGSKARLLLEI